jgi:aspartyl/glutamyl-tRNA(Asn/Gln) amidotransferase C subunit
MSIDKNTVRKVASLARLEIDEAGLEKMTPKLNGILQWIEQLQALNTGQCRAAGECRQYRAQAPHRRR